VGDGAGIGLIVGMVTWLVGNRLAGLVWDAPVGPTVAFAVAIAAGIVTSLVAGARLARVVRREG
jgi:prepilin signal peptidase PulO-like enzyme (type II secretory pathway)